MRILSIYSDKDCVLKACIEQLPVENFHGASGHIQMLEYQEALQHCKDTSVPFENQVKVGEWMGRNGECIELIPDTFYPCEIYVEIVHGMSAGWQPTYNNPDNSGCEQPAEPIELARLSPVAPEPSFKEKPDESQAILWIEVHKLMMTYDGVQLLDRLEKFTITRKKENN